MPGEKRSREAWDLPKDAMLISLLMHQSDIGRRAESGFKKEAWTEVRLQFNSKFHTDYRVRVLWIRATLQMLDQARDDDEQPNIP